MKSRSEHYSRSGTRRLMQAQDRVRGETGEYRLYTFAPERSCQSPCRKECPHPEFRKETGMPRHRPDRTEHTVCKITPPLCKRSEQVLPCFFVRAQRCGCDIQIPFQRDRGSVIERMRECCRRMDPLETMLMQGERGKEGRSNR